MKKCILIFEFLLIASLFFSCDLKNTENVPIPRFFTKTFKGAINNKYKFEMTIVKADDSLKGWYQYSDKERSLKLNGAIDRDGNFKMEEYDNWKITGSFNGKYGDNKAYGEWSLPDGSKKMAFSMTEVMSPTSCAKEEVKIGNSDDPIYLHTCTYGKFKTIATGSPDYAGRYSWEYVLYEKKNEKYVQVKNTALFKENQQQLLSLINKRIHQEYKDYFSDPHTKDCAQDKSIPLFEFDQLGIEFEDDKIKFNTSLGLGWACLNVDGATATFKIEEIKKYLN